MRDHRFYNFLHKQIPVMIGLSLFPGLGYIFLGWLHGIETPALVWYGAMVLLSVWGYKLYRSFHYETMGLAQVTHWYQHLTVFFYLFFILWAAIFLIYVWEDAYKLHYVAIFTEIGASVVASALLSCDRRLFVPTITILMVPLIIYFASIGEWFGYVLTVFATIFSGVLLYAADSSRNLLQQTQYQASHDTLTGLHNRHFFIEHLQQFMNSLHQSKRFSYLLLIDLDHFKNVNDSLGHDVGDALLQEVAGRLQKHCVKGNVLARLGGDEFIVTGSEFIDRDTCEAEASALATTLLNSLKKNYVIDRHHLYISCSIGISLISAESDNANRFIKEADIAMYEVKATGRDGVFLFSDEMSARVERNLRLERLLHFALRENEISLVFQPQLNPDGEVCGAESLVRWHSKELGTISPVEFIPIAEQTGLIVELGNHILEQAFIQLSRWQEQGMELQQLSINISMRQFMHQSFVEQVRRLTARHLNSESLQFLVFEVTESLVAEDIHKVIAIMEELHAIGIRFSMDDFGTGYSSLSYLKQLPIDEIKIDRAFVAKVDQDEEDQAMITTILKMAQIFGLSIVAEGVETESQWHFLRQRGCDYFQGYLFAKPLTVEAFEQFYRENRPAKS